MGAQICGRQKQTDEEIHIDQLANPGSEQEVEPPNAKSAKKIQSRWKSYKILTLLRVAEQIRKLNEDSKQKGEFATEDEMLAKTSKKVIDQEKLLKQFDRHPEIKEFTFCIERNPVKIGDGSIYKGYWDREGKKCGYGILIRNDGSKYEGFWKNDQINGRGRYIDGTGSFYYEGNTPIK